MTAFHGRARIEALAGADPEERERIILSMTPQDLIAEDIKFESWAHDNQLPPTEEGWRTWLMLAGRGFGKTRAGAEWIHGLALARPGSRIALVGASLIEARSIMVEGVSGLLTVARNHGRRVQWEPSLGRLKWSNGSEAQLFSGDSPEGLRGPEHDFAWCDELAKWRDPDATWDNLQFGLRRGMRPRSLVTTTPRPLKVLERINQMPRTITTQGKTTDNLNLDEEVVKLIFATYGGTRLGRQELDGELILDVEGALWTRALIEQSRHTGPLPPFDRVMVGVDPPAGASEDSDACGIVVCAKAGERFFVLEDATVRTLRPEGWSAMVAAAAARWQTPLVVAEANQGGAMVESVLKAADDGLKVRLVHASRGKAARAEPVSLLFEKGRVALAGEFGPLEDQLVGIQAGGGYEGPGRSPDRADAMVWAITALSETRSGVPRVRGL